MRSLAHHEHKPNTGEIPDCSDLVVGDAGGSCGVTVRWLLRVDSSGVITDAAARVRGPRTAVATASALREELIGAHVVDATRVGILTLHHTFAEMSAGDAERAATVEDALHEALSTAIRAYSGPPQGQIDVIVAMSGGVDSAVALHRVRASGRTPIGATLQLWIDPQAPDASRACCSGDSVRRARRTCHAAGVGHVMMHRETEFLGAVVGPVLRAYEQGETPNPCTTCNGSFRIHELVALADAIGAARVATGHYVRRIDTEHGPRFARGVDPVKDQSYMLSRLVSDHRIGDRLEFPLGGSTKPQVREQARQLGLVQADTPDSQDICFLGGGDYREFLARSRSAGPAGTVVTTDGVTLGQHDGIAGFTVGQRRGLGRFTSGRPVAGDGPTYVVGVDGTSGTVVVGSEHDLVHRDVPLSDLRLAPGVTPGDLADIVMQPRHGRQSVVRCSVAIDGDTAVARVADGMRAPAAGQVACLFGDDGTVLGSAVIAVAHLMGDLPTR